MIDLVPWPARFLVHPRKVTDYLLDPSSEDGRSKCAYFESYGYRRVEASTLIAALVRHGRIELFAAIKVSPWGLKFLFDGPMPAPNGRDANLLTVWQVKAGSDATAHFLTARPSPRRALGTVPVPQALDPSRRDRERHALFPPPFRC